MELLRPSSVAELDGGLFVHGGTEVVPLLNDGLLSAETLVDVRGVVPRGVDGSTIGAGTTLGELEADASIPDALREACRLASSPQLRNMGSLGGNLLGSCRKPWDLQELDAALRRAFDLSQARREPRPPFPALRVGFERVLFVGASADYRRIERMTRLDMIPIDNEQDRPDIFDHRPRLLLGEGRIHRHEGRTAPQDAEIDVEVAQAYSAPEGDAVTGLDA